MDGRDAFFDAKAGRRQCRDELERARLQHEARYENPWHQQLNEGVVSLKWLALLPTWHRRGFIEASKTRVTICRAYRERLHSKNRRCYVPTFHWPVFTHSGPEAACHSPTASGMKPGAVAGGSTAQGSLQNICDGWIASSQCRKLPAGFVKILIC